MRPSYRTAACVLTLLLLGVPDSLPGHDPSRHGFKLVTFARPFTPPDFSLMDLSGKRAGLAEFRGQYVLLNFWATWCPPCLEEMPSLDVLYQRYRHRGFAVLAVSSDQEGARVVQGFIEKLGVSFPSLLDPDGRVSSAYGAKNLPLSFLLDRQGNVIAAAQGARDWASPEALSTLEEIIAPP